MNNAVKTINKNQTALAGAIVLPKIQKGSGKFLMTAIAADEIKGIEPCQITYGSKTYSGAKVYTVHGDYFKALVNPSGLMLGWSQAKSSGTALITMDSVTGFLPGYTNEINSMKALQSGQIINP